MVSSGLTRELACPAFFLSHHVAEACWVLIVDKGSSRRGSRLSGDSSILGICIDYYHHICGSDAGS